MSYVNALAHYDALGLVSCSQSSQLHANACGNLLDAKIGKIVGRFAVNWHEAARISVSNSEKAIFCPLLIGFAGTQNGAMKALIMDRIGKKLRFQTQAGMCAKLLPAG